jgi:hypothetical protein
LAFFIEEITLYPDNLSLRKTADVATAAPSALYRGINVGNALDAPA